MGICGAGSSSGQKRKSTGDEDNDDDDPLWRLSLGSIYSSVAAAASTLSSSRDSSIPAALPERPVVPRHSAATSPAAANLLPHAPPVPVGTAFLATGVLAQAQTASSPSLLDDGNGAPPTQLASLPMSSPRILVAPSTISLVPAKQAIAMSTTPFPPVKQDVESRALPARPMYRSVRRRPNGAPQPVGGGSDLTANPPANNFHVSVDDSPANGGLITSPPFPWATKRVAIHHSIDELSERGIRTVEGEVQCRRCDTRKVVSYDIAAKFSEVREFVSRHIVDMDDRAPPTWTSPTLPDCDGCGQKNSLRPVIPTEKEKINWVFLLLGQTLGLCTLDQLKHFCAHTKQHRTGAKDRVLYSTYMELCNQLCPDKLFNVTAERQKRSQQYS